VGGTITFFNGDNRAAYLAFIHFSVFTTLIFFSELYYKEFKLKKKIHFKAHPTRITFEEFCSRVNKGE
jgi:hypothetical protein